MIIAQVRVRVKVRVRNLGFLRGLGLRVSGSGSDIRVSGSVINRVSDRVSTNAPLQVARHYVRLCTPLLMYIHFFLAHPLSLHYNY